MISHWPQPQRCSRPVERVRDDPGDPARVIVTYRGVPGTASMTITACLATCLFTPDTDIQIQPGRGA